MLTRNLPQYRPLVVLTLVGVVLIGLGANPGIRFLYFYLTGKKLREPPARLSR